MDQTSAQHLIGGNQEMSLENQIKPRAGASAESPNPSKHGVKWEASPVPCQSHFAPAVAQLNKAESSILLEKPHLHPCNVQPGLSHLRSPSIPQLH